VFQDQEPIKLVHQRTTAIIVDKSSSVNSGEIELAITDLSDGKVKIRTDENFFDPGENENQFIFYCNEVVNYCNLEKGKSYEVTAWIDGNNALLRKVEIGDVIDIPLLSLAFLFLQPEYCFNTSGVFDDLCFPDRSVIEEVVIDVNRFVQQTFPLPTAGLKLAPNLGQVGNALISDGTPGADFGAEKGFSPPCLAPDIINPFYNKAFDNDIEITRQILIVGEGNPKRGVVLVPDNYFINYFPQFPNIQGLHINSGKTNTGEIVFSRLDADKSVPLHELGHTYKLPVSGTVSSNGREEYDLTSNCKADDRNLGPRTDGFNVYASDNPIVQVGEFISDHRSIMGSSKDETKFWVTAENWDRLLTTVPSTRLDPILLSITVRFDENTGDAIFSSAFDLLGEVDNLESGKYQIVLKDIGGNIIFTGKFDQAGFAFEGSGGEIRDPDFPTILVVPFSDDTSILEIRDMNGDILGSVDPTEKVVTEGVKEILRGCREIDALTTTNLLSFADAFTMGLKENSSEALQSLTQLREAVSTSEQFSCLSKTVFRTMERFLESLDRSRVRVEKRFGISNVLIGDLDNDGDVDRDDLNILLASRNQPASGPDDPKDLDGDGMITALDARKLTQLCTRPRCATE